MSAQAQPRAARAHRGRPLTTGLAVVGLALAAALGAGCGDDSGPGTPQPRLDTTLLDFGSVDVGASAERTFTLSNAGGGVLEGSFAGTVCDPPSVPTEAACWSLVGETSYRLMAYESRTFTVRFAPYELSVGGAHCGLGASHCQIESAHGIVHCTATGVAGP